MHLHVTGLMLLDPSSAPDGFGFARFEKLLAARIGQLDALTHRVVPVPFGIDHPLVVPHEVDLAEHLRQVVLPGKPGSKKAMRAMQNLIDEFCSTPLDHSRPLWEMLFIEGLTDGRFALVAKLHHAMIDGVSGVGVMADLLDLEADAPLEQPQGDKDSELRDDGRDQGTHQRRIHPSRNTLPARSCGTPLRTAWPIHCDR